MRPAANRRVRCVSSASSGGVSPTGVVIADAVCCCSLGLAVPRIEVRTPRRIPPACSRSTSPWSLPPRTFRRLRSATLPMSPFPDLPFLSYRRDLVPRGFAPLAGPYHRTSYEDVRWPTLPGPCSPSRSPSCHSLRSDRASMMPSITVCSTFAYRRIRVRPIFAVRRRSVPCPVSCALATRVASGIRRIPRRAACSCDHAAQVGRVPVAFFDIAASEYFGFAGGRSRSPSQTIRRPALLVWCSFGHHSVAYTARCSPEAGKPASRGCHPNRFLAVS